MKLKDGLEHQLRRIQMESRRSQMLIWTMTTMPDMSRQMMKMMSYWKRTLDVSRPESFAERDARKLAQSLPRHQLQLEEMKMKKKWTESGLTSKKSRMTTSLNTWKI